MQVKVLLVDDEKQFVETLAMRLEVRDYAVATAFSGEQALEYLRAQDADVVVLDIQMPGLSGMDTLREIKKIRPLTEVILLTGHATVETAVEGMRLGAFDYLLKPTEIDQLVDKITRAHRRKLRRLEEEVARKTIALERSQQELAKSEKLYKSLVESAEDAILNVDAKGEIISINRYGAKILGYTKQGILGKTISEVVPGDTGKEITRLIDEVFAHGTGRRTTLEVPVGGKHYFFNINLAPIRENDTVMSILIIAHDITSQKKMEDQLYHTEKLASLGQLAAGVAHEINNPLAIILGFADILLERVKEDSEEYKIIKTIERQGLTCKKIVENLMTFARAPEKSAYDADINGTIETLLEVVKATILTKKVKVQLDLADNLPRVRGDADQLQQVFLNLITNAVLAMPQGGLLTISTRLNADKERVQIKFADTGVGIKKEHLTRIYDPFFTTRKVGEGTGLGLSVSYAIVQKFGGTITCESKTREAAGEGASGTTFTISLPVATPPRQEGRAAEAVQAGTDSPG
jgi:two-component system NtrC family sensor kinase